MDRVSTIVVGVDFSGNSRSAVAQAMRMARWDDATVHMVHVIESVFVADVAKAYGVEEGDFRDSVVESAQRRADELVSAARRVNLLVAQSTLPQVEVQVDIRVGNPVTQLLRYVREMSADLLVLGSSGWSGPNRGPGVLATKCVRRAPAKVMLVRDLSAEAFKRIACCVDFSDTCRLAVEQAIRIARQDDANLMFVYAFTPPWEILHYAACLPEASPDFQRGYRDQLHARLTQFVRRFESETSGLAVECHVTESVDSKFGLADFVRSSGADLVVLGTQGLSESEAMLMGRTAERIVREAPCSILAIKPRDFSGDLT